MFWNRKSYVTFLLVWVSCSFLAFQQVAHVSSYCRFVRCRWKLDYYASERVNEQTDGKRQPRNKQLGECHSFWEESNGSNFIYILRTLFLCVCFYVGSSSVYLNWKYNFYQKRKIYIFYIEFKIQFDWDLLIYINY